jgi:hypothetical protein
MQLLQTATQAQTLQMHLHLFLLVLGVPWGTLQPAMQQQQQGERVRLVLVPRVRSSAQGMV